MQKKVLILPARALYGMPVAALQTYKVDMALAAMHAATELDREQYRQAMELANKIINNKVGGRNLGM